MALSARTRLSLSLGEMVRLASAALAGASSAALGPPAEQPGEFATARALHALRHEVEEHATILGEAVSADSAPDTRTLLVAIYVNAEAEEMERLARQVADIDDVRAAWMPERVRAVLLDMRDVSLRTVDMVASALDRPRRVDEDSADLAVRKLAELRDEAYAALVGSGAKASPRAVSSTVLLARSFERYAEHAAAILRHSRVLALEGSHG